MKYSTLYFANCNDPNTYKWDVIFLKVGGWTEVYQGLTFVTVRGAGHEVPLFKPRAALQVLKSFLRGEPLPKS